MNGLSSYVPPGEQIRVESRRREGKVCIRFTDTGIGLPAENLESVFEMFSQVHPPGSQGNAGLGIGLSLARRLVEMHGGTIVAHSGGIGRGAEFVVELPALEAQTVAPAHGTRAAASAPALRVLVVDDNVDAASSVADLLGALGHEVQVSYDGASAVAEAERFRPHLVLLDLGMPLMDGFQAARSMRQHDWGRRMHIVALTGWGQDQVRHRTREAGFDDHFVKPMGLQDMTQLLEVVRVQ